MLSDLNSIMDSANESTESKKSTGGKSFKRRSNVVSQVTVTTVKTEDDYEDHPSYKKGYEKAEEGARGSNPYKIDSNDPDYQVAFAYGYNRYLKDNY